MWPFRKRSLDLDTAIEQALSVGDFRIPGQFIVFDLGDEFTYIQFSIRPKGLHCYWPKGVAALDKLESRFAQFLAHRGFDRLDAQETDVAEFLDTFEPGQYAIYDDGYYVQVGRDHQTVRSFVVDAFSDVFGWFEEDSLSAKIAYHA